MDDATFLELRTRFYKLPAICLCVVLALEILPVEALPGPVRMLLAGAYFGALATALLQAMGPLREYLSAYYRWSYADCGPALEKSCQLFLHSVHLAVRPAAIAGLAFVVGMGLKVLASWPALAALHALRPLYQLAWMAGGAALLLYPFVGSYLINAAYHRHRILAEQAETDDYRPRKPKALREAAAASRTEQVPVEVVGPLAFRAGGLGWSWEDFYKSAVVFGASGTGKTVCVLNALLDGLLASAAQSELPPAGLILDPKGDFRDKIRLLCERHGRANDLLVLDPYDQTTSIRWNPLDSVDDELELAGRFASVLESTGMKAGQDSFWIDSAKKFLRHAICLVRLTEPDRPPCFEDVMRLAVSDTELADRAERLPEGSSAGDQALMFFANEWTTLAQETRSSVQAYLTNMIDPFLMEPYAEVFSGESTLRISEMLDQGKILYVHMPIADKEVMAKVVGVFAKLEYYREVLRRPDKPRPSFFLCDEFQAFLTAAVGKGDADFFERSRQSRHANLIATQNLPALKKVLEKPEPVMNLLGNCAVKLFMRNTDNETNQYASELFGEKLVAMASQNIGGGGARAGASHGASFQYDAKVRKEVFTALATPSREEGVAFAETIVHLASRARVAKHRLRWPVHLLQADANPAPQRPHERRAKPVRTVRRIHV